MDIRTKDYPKQYRQIWEEVREAIDRVLLGDDPILGVEVERFEKELATFHEVPHAIGVGSGTAALTLAMRALDIGAGHEVITCAHTFTGVLSAILEVGATPVLVEPDPVSLLLTVEAAAEVITPRTRAVLAVHLYGHPVDATALASLCERRNLLLLEDVAQAHGARWRGQPLGGFGSAAAMSFHPSKNLAAFGDGGAVLCRSDATAARLRVLRNLGKEDKHRFTAVSPNSKLDTLQAAILRVRLRHLEDGIERRRSHARLYQERLEGVGDLALPVEHPEARHAWHLFVVRTAHREALRRHLAGRGIGTGVHYPIAAHRQPAIVERLGALSLPRTEELADRVLTLPLSYEHEREEIERVATEVRAFFGEPVMLEVAVLGGGVAAAKLCDALADHGGLDRPVRIRLAARRAERVEGIARHASERVGRRRPAWRVAASPTVTDAIRGADIILNLIRVGGLAARAWDEHFPEAFGQVGDEGLGLGGVANAWRSLPVMDRLAGTIAREAPDALVLNMAAPLGVTTRCFLEAGVHTLGLCELPGLTRDRWRRLLPTGGNAALHYCGLNHLGWFWPADAAGAAILDAAVRAGEVDGEILERFGAAPLHYYATLFDAAAAARLRSTRRPGRARELADLAEVIFASMIARPGGEIPQFAARPTPWFDRVVAPVIDAVAGPGRFSDFLNLPNDGAWLAGSPAGIVVEVPADVAGGEVTRQPQPPPPRPVSEFLLACAQSEDLNYRAAAARDRRMLVRAIEALPTSLPAARMDEIVARIIEGERFAETSDSLLPVS